MNRIHALTLTLLATLCACGTSDSTADPSGGSRTNPIAASPSETVRCFLDAVRAGDRSVATALLTSAARTALDGDGELGLHGDGIRGYDLGAESIDGDEATVGATIHEDDSEQQTDFLLRRENGVWRIRGMSVSFGDGRFTLDFEAVDDLVEGIGKEIGEQIAQQFEEAFSEMQAAFEQGGTREQIEEERATFLALEAVERTAFEASWRIDVDGAGRPAAEVLAEILEPAGLGFAAGEHAAALAENVSTRAHGVSRVEAVERIAADSGLHPVWPDPNEAMGEPATLTFAAGPRPLPAAFTGPFLVEVSELREDAPRPVGALELSVRALGLPAGALALQDEVGETLHVEQVRSAADTALVDESVSYWGTPTITGGYFSASLSQDLTGLLRGVEEIDRVRGEVRFALPTAVETVTLDGQTEELSVGAGTLALTQWGETTRFEVRGDADVVAGLAVRMSPLRASGEPLGTHYAGANGWGEQLQADLQCPEAPAKLEVKLCTRADFAFPFELRDIPLARFREQPERLAELTFDGDAPVRARQVGGFARAEGQAEATLELVNGCNKDVHVAMIEFQYLDDGGTQLEDFPHTLQGDYDFDLGGAGVLVASGETERETTFAAFLPDAATRLRCVVQRVEFADGTVWEHEE